MGRGKWVHIFPEYISSKVIVVERIEFEYAYFETTVEYFSLYTADTLFSLSLPIYIYILRERETDREKEREREREREREMGEEFAEENYSN